MRDTPLSFVMAGPAEGRVTAIHVFPAAEKTWMAVTSTAMTKGESTTR